MSPIELKGRLKTSLTPEDNYCPVGVDNCAGHCSCCERSNWRTSDNLNRKPRKSIIDCRYKNITTMPGHMPSGELEL